jgi:hypothetical protein
MRQGPEGRPLNVSPDRKGWEHDDETPSTVGAALPQVRGSQPSLPDWFRFPDLHVTEEAP